MPLMAKGDQAEPVLYCVKKRCIEKENKEPNSARLKLIKTWKVKGQGGVWMETGIFECPNCNHRYRKHIRSGREIEHPEVAKKRMGEALLGLASNIEAEYGRDSD